MNERKMDEKRTQSERREETREALVAAACRLFGQQGYETTSLEEIAESCDMTIRPIYYHFGSKIGLFSEVHDLMEAQALEALNSGSSVLAWEAFMKLCNDPAFRQIILEDGPNILGRAHWSDSGRFSWSGALTSGEAGPDYRAENQTGMRDRVARAALTEAAIAVIESGHDTLARSEAVELISKLLPENPAAANR